MKKNMGEELNEHDGCSAEECKTASCSKRKEKGCFNLVKRFLCLWGSLGHASRRVVLIVVAALLLFLLGGVAVKCYMDSMDAPKVQESIATIQEIKLKGEIYVCSAIVEDYVIERQKEKRILLSDKDHSCVQTLTQKCSYKINLSDVAYLANDSIKVVYVHMPKIEYVASTQSASFISDDSQWWAKHMPNTNTMKRKVEKQIQLRFDTPNNRRKAERYAEDAVSGMLAKLGYQTEFFNSLQSGSFEER